MLSNKKLEIPILYISLITLGFVIIFSVFNAYHVAIIGAIYEILWLPAVLSAIILPVLSFFFWMKSGFQLKSKYLFALLISLGSVCILAIK